MSNYYNEIDPYAAQWLRNLIAAGHIGAGDVDERSIEDVTPDELASYTQCHFFAGIGVWAFALRRGGWRDERPVWTGSCPCQPFSAAGKGAGFADERHLWPAWQHLISERRPPVIFGEQVASKDAGPWLDLVQDDVEALGYAFGAVPFPSAGIGAPHIRDRLYWAAGRGDRRDLVPSGNVRGLADADQEQRGRRPNCELLTDGPQAGRQQSYGELEPDFKTCSVGHHHHSGLPACQCCAVGRTGRRQERGATQQSSCASCGLAITDEVGHDGVGDIGGKEFEGSGRIHAARHPGNALGVANCPGDGWREERQDAGGQSFGNLAQGFTARSVGGGDSRPGPTNGLWGAADWLLCRDGKWRPVEPGTFPLAHGAASRVGRLRAYGNAINAEAARAFIEACMSCEP